MLARAREGAAEGLVAVADHQTAGRGRLGRRWEAPAGVNLLCSILLRPEVPSWLSVARVSLAGRDAATQVTGGRVVPGLKWPNDLVTRDGGLKVAGVLAEVDAGAVVVGIGVNVGWAPPDLPAACLAADGSIHRDEMLDAMLASLEGWLAATDAAVARGYREACVTIGKPVRVELADETFTGTAADIADDGRLFVDVGVCVRDVAAGDVVHLR